MKKTVKLSALLLCIAGMFSSSAMAVDGYKDLKFGTPKQQVLKTKLCNLMEAPNKQPGVESYICLDFKFGGKKTVAMFFFLDNKFSRLGVVQPFDSVTSLASQLVKKYGDPIESPDEQRLKDLYEKEDISADIVFDNRTVILRLMSDNNMKKQAVLMYSAADYESKLSEKQESSVKDDL